MTIIGSPLEQCDRALDKMQMYRWLTEHNYRCAKSYDSKDDFYRELDAGRITMPVFVKPVKGSASLKINKAETKETLDFLFDNNEGLMIQEFLHGQEIGADVYIDLISGEVVSVFTKKKLLMRAGETDKAVSFKDEKLFDFIERFAYECGCDHMKLIENNVNGIANKKNIGNYDAGVYMMKYVEVLVTKL